MTSVAAMVNTASPANLTAIRRVRLTGTASRYRRVPVFASPAIESPAIAPTAISRKNGSSMASAVSATNRPLLTTLVRNTGPSFGSVGAELFTDTARMKGTDASTASPAQLRRRPKMSHSSDRRNRVLTRDRGAASRTAAVSTADIEALPGQADEHLLQIRRGDDESAYRDIVIDQRGDHLLRRDLAEQRGGQLLTDLDAGHAQRGERAPGGARVCRAH